MRIFTRCFMMSLACLFMMTSSAQNRRYLDPIFKEVNVTAPQGLAENYTILNWIATGGVAHTLKQPLVAQFYSPKGDTKTNRPLIIYIHTGNFFPYPANGSCGGTMQDSSNVEMATRLAKMGYVVAVVNYRQGWNPFDQNELIRRFFLINAAYRGVQDMSTYVRYFRRSVAELGNPHGIDPNKITLWGQGTGGYLSLAAAYLKSYPEIFNTADPLKFVLTPPVAPSNIPMVIEGYNGTLTAEGPITKVDATYNALLKLPLGDTLCIPYHVGFSSNFALAVNLGGALGDSTWMSPGEVPLISFHVDTDPFAPYKTDVLNVPTPLGPQPVVEVSGSFDLAKRGDRLGLNNVFKTIPTGRDPFNAFNKTGNLGYYEFRGTPANSSSPWEWAATASTSSGASGCNINPVTSKTYIDTIIGYFAPRGCVALGLNCDFNSSVKEVSEAQVNLFMSPNPATAEINISVANDKPIRSYSVYDISGKMLRNYNDVNANYLTLRRENLQNGLYLVQLRFDEGVLTKRVIFE